MHRLAPRFAPVCVLLSTLLSAVSTSAARAQSHETASPWAATGVGILVLQPGPDGKDATVSSLSPGTNYGSHEWFVGVGLSYFAGFLEFDISDLPVDAVVTSAQLTLWGEFKDGTITFDPVGYPWDEATVTWPTQPSVIYPSMALTYPVSRGDPSGPCYWGCTQDFDVTSIVNAWAGGTIPRSGFRIIGNTGSISCLIATSDNLTHPWPRLWIQYDSNTPVASTTWGRLKTIYR